MAGDGREGHRDRKRVPPGRTTALVVAQAVRAAGTVVCEPVDRIRVEFPAEAMSSVFGVLGRHGVVPEAPTIEGGFAVVGGTMRTTGVDAVRRELRGIAQGQAVFAARPDHFAPVRSG